jgi:signal transduction histidine kinase
MSIYYFSSNYRQLDFYRRLKNRAINTAKVLMEVEEVNADLLRRMERNNPASLPNQYIVIFNYKNEELYSSEGAKTIPVDTALLNKIRLNQELKFTYANFEAVGFLFTDKYDRFTVVAAARDVYGLDALENLRNVLIITLSVSAVLISILGWIYAGKVLSPITKIVNEVSNITEVNLDQRLGEGNQKDELSQLARTFNRMLKRLQDAFASQKNFIANASHEIKTPITVMSSEIEVALLHDRSKEYYAAALKSVLTGLKGLNKLSSQLLLLAQTSADQPEKNFTLLRIDDILWEIKEEITKTHPDYYIDIQLEMGLEHESLQIKGDEQLVKVAILNLIDNGCKYSIDQRVEIVLKVKAGKAISAEFTNSSTEIDPNTIERIFEPFYRGKNNKKVKGSGIGLSLVQRIMNLHSGRIDVTLPAEGKTRFTISFPIER